MNTRVLVLAPLPEPVTGQSYATEKFLLNSKLNIKCINNNLENKNFIFKVLYSLVIIFKFSILLFLCKPSVVYFTGSRSLLGSITDIYAMLICKLTSVPMVNHLHGSDFPKFLNARCSYYNILYRFVYRAVKTTIVLTDTMASEIENLNLPGNIKKVSNFSESRKLVNAEGKHSVSLLYFSNIMYSKGIFLLLDAFEDLSKKYDLNLVIAGGIVGDNYLNKAETEKRFMKYLETLNSNNVSYLGVVRAEEKVRVLTQSDIMVLPTFYRSEAAPISIIEAMSYSCAIVTSKYRYLPDIVNDSFGLLVKPNDTDSLRYSIEQLLIDRKLLSDMQLQAFKVASTEYTLEKFVFELDNILVARGNNG